MKCLKLVAFSAAAIALLPSCEDQTEFEVNKMPGRCSLEGKIIYNEGTRVEDGKFVYDLKPVAGKQIIVRVDRDKYTDDGRGYAEFYTTTDLEGNYSISIPTPLTGTISARVIVPEFKGERQVIEKKNNEIRSELQEVVYKANCEVDLSNHGIVYQNIRCMECGAKPTINYYNYTASLKCQVGLGREYVTEPIKTSKKNYFGGTVTNWTDGERYYCYEPAGAYDVIISVAYNDGTEMTYNATTDAQGWLDMQIPVTSFPASFTYSLQVLPKYGNYTRYREDMVEYVPNTSKPDEVSTYKRYLPETLKGYFAQNCQFTSTASYPMAKEVCTSTIWKMIAFEPLNGNADLYEYSSSVYTGYNSWYSDLLESLKEQEESAQ